MTRHRPATEVGTLASPNDVLYKPFIATLSPNVRPAQQKAPCSSLPALYNTQDTAGAEQSKQDVRPSSIPTRTASNSSTCRRADITLAAQHSSDSTSPGVGAFLEQEHGSKRAAGRVPITLDFESHSCRPC